MINPNKIVCGTRFFIILQSQEKKEEGRRG